MPHVRLPNLAGLLLALSSAVATASAAELADLALHKPACSSSIENDEHSAAQANDGNPQTFWCADDEPENGPEWWQVDLGKPCEVSGCQIRWPYAGNCYRYKIEGSADRKTWSLLSDQTHARARSQVHQITFPQPPTVRYVKITVTGFDEGCWASIAEVKVFGSENSRGATR